MPDVMEQARRLPARPVGGVLAELARLQEEKRSNWMLPPVTVALSNGMSLRGEYLAAHELDTPQATILLRTGGVGDAVDVAYVPVASIVALTIHHTAATLAPLSFGALRERGGGVPSRLELERRLRDLTEWLSAEVGATVTATVAWEALPRTDAARLDVGELLEDLRAVLDGFLADDLGREAVRDGVRSLRIVVGERADATLQDGELRYTVGLDGDETALLDRRELRRTLSARL